jgi:hypothetical protein
MPRIELRFLDHSARTLSVLEVAIPVAEPGCSEENHITLYVL